MPIDMEAMLKSLGGAGDVPIDQQRQGVSGDQRQQGGGMGKIVQMILPALMGMLAGGGMKKMMGGMKANGLTSEVDSWTSTDENKTVSPSQLTEALPDTVSQLAQQAGVTNDEAADALTTVLPTVVDKATPEGALPDDTSGLDELFSAIAKKLSA